MLQMLMSGNICTGSDEIGGGRGGAEEGGRRRIGSAGEGRGCAEGEDVKTEAKNDADEGKIHQVEQALEWSVQN